MKNIERTYLATYFLSSFRNLREDLVFKSFIDLLYSIKNENNIEKNIKYFSDFVYNLNEQNYEDFSEYMKEYILNNKKEFQNETHIEDELKILVNLSKIGYEDLKDILVQKYPEYKDLFDNLPYFSNSNFNLTYDEFKSELNFKDKIFKENNAFVFDDNFNIRPVKQKETIKFSSLKGYVQQKKVLYENTQSFLKGVRVNNILLYGDAGCGKSSSVRALLNEFKELKIVQIFKNNLINLDKLYLRLESLPYKFIIFADDISFDETDNVFSTMKAVIEGSLVQCPKNVVIYATSNRRHLVKESFQGRSGDEIHLRDTMNEINSLSERFGINLFFSKPTNDEFNQIVLEVAKENNLDIPEKELLEKAHRLALIKGQKSPRAIKQLVDNIKANVEI